MDALITKDNKTNQRTKFGKVLNALGVNDQDALSWIKQHKNYLKQTEQEIVVVPESHREKLAAKKAEWKAKKDAEVLSSPTKKGSKTTKTESASKNTGRSPTKGTPPKGGRSPTKGTPPKAGRGRGKK